MSDLMSTVKILAGSTVEIAAASVGDQPLVAAVRLAEENNSLESLNGLEVVEVSAEVPEEAKVEEDMIGRFDPKTGGEELEELPSAFHTVEETVVHVKSEADGTVEAEVYVESPASSEENSVTEMESILELDDYVESPASSEEASVSEMESILELEESVSPVVMLSEDDTISGPAEATSETVMAVSQRIEEDKSLWHEPAATETEHSDLAAPPTDLEEALQATTEVAAEMMLDAVEEAKPVKASEEAAESGNVTMTMTQA